MIFLAAIFGYWVNGAVGAFIGLAIVLILNFVIKSFNVNNNVHATTLFLNSLFSILAKMAKADGVIAKEEIDAVTQFMNAIRLSSYICRCVNLNTRVFFLEFHLLVRAKHRQNTQLPKALHRQPLAFPHWLLPYIDWHIRRLIARLMTLF
jgi:hypothetical protein